MKEVGRICVKTAGRDAGKYCVILTDDDDRVLIDGQTRRREVNLKHLEPTTKKIDIDEEASSEDVQDAFDELGFESEELEKPNSNNTKKEMMEYLDKKDVDYKQSMLKNEIYELVKQN